MKETKKQSHVTVIITEISGEKFEENSKVMFITPVVGI